MEKTGKCRANCIKLRSIATGWFWWNFWHKHEIVSIEILTMLNLPLNHGKTTIFFAHCRRNPRLCREGHEAMRRGAMLDRAWVETSQRFSHGCEPHITPPIVDNKRRFSSEWFGVFPLPWSGSERLRGHEEVLERSSCGNNLGMTMVSPIPISIHSRSF